MLKEERFNCMVKSRHRMNWEAKNMKGHIFLAIGAVVLVVISSVLGSQQPSDTNDLQTLQDYLRHASLNNAELKAKFHKWKAVVEQIPQARSLPDPKFTYGYFIEEVETRVGPQKQKLGIMQTFPWFGKIEAATDAAAAAAKAAHKHYEAAKLKLFFEVKDSFREYAYLARAVDLAEQNLELLKHFEQVARTRYTADVGSHPDVIRAQIELATLDDKLKSLAEMRKPIVTRLNSVLNRNVDLPLPWPATQQFKAVIIDRESVFWLLQTQGLSWQRKSPIRM
jgi:outer membrane protein TolC